MPIRVGHGVDTWFYGGLKSDTVSECLIRVGQVSCKCQCPTRTRHSLWSVRAS